MFLSQTAADLRFALRMLAKAPGHTAVLVLTLALGIGASTTIFSVVNSVVLQPLPYERPDALVRVYTEFPAGNLRKFWMSPPEYWDLARGCRSCASVATMGRGTASISGGDRPVRVEAAWATHSLLPTLGVRPALGRTFSADEDLPGDPTVVVIGHGLWQRAFGGDPDVVGRRVLLDAVPVTIVGVMPDGFDYPGGMEAWVPAGLDPAATNRGSHWLETIVRLRPGVSLAALRAELAALTAAWGEGKLATDHTIHADTHPMIALPLHGEVVGSVARTLWLLQGAVLFVLLIAIANVTNLLLARAEARNREIAVRHALGAPRRRLVRQLLTESLLLGAIGGGLGVLVAVWALDATIAVLPRSAPRVTEIALDASALAFALACTVGASLLFGLAPILHTRRADLHGSLKDGSRAATGSRARVRVRRALVVVEIALAVVLVIGCALMVKSFARLQRVDLGFRPDHALTFEVEIPAKTYPTDAAATAFWRRLEERLRALPGVTAAGLVGGLPPERRINANDLGLPGRSPPAPGEPPWNVDFWNIVGDDAFAALGARIVRGRGLARSDVAGASHAVVINQAFADKYFPGEDPVGQPIDVSPWKSPDGPHQTVVGVVADLKNAGIDRPAGTEVFFTLWQAAEIADHTARTMRAVVRTSGDPAALAPAVHRAVAELDATLALSKVATLDHLVWEGVAKPRFLTFLLTAFAALAVALAAIGIYGVMAFTVAQRTHEIGIRVALGAQPAQVRALVLRQAAALAAAGVAIGVVAAVALEAALDASVSSVLYGERLRDPLLFVAVTAIVIAAAVIATWLPARRATRVAPTVALRAE